MQELFKRKIKKEPFLNVFSRVCSMCRVDKLSSLIWLSCVTLKLLKHEPSQIFIYKPLNPFWFREQVDYRLKVCIFVLEVVVILPAFWMLFPSYGLFCTSENSCTLVAFIFYPVKQFHLLFNHLFSVALISCDRRLRRLYKNFEWVHFLCLPLPLLKHGI